MGQRDLFQEARRLVFCGMELADGGFLGLRTQLRQGAALARGSLGGVVAEVVSPEHATFPVRRASSGDWGWRRCRLADAGQVSGDAGRLGDHCEYAEAALTAWAGEDVDRERPL